MDGPACDVDNTTRVKLGESTDSGTYWCLVVNPYLGLGTFSPGVERGYVIVAVAEDAAKVAPMRRRNG